MFEFQSKYSKKVLVWALISAYGEIAFKMIEETLTADSYIAQVLEQVIAEQELLMKDQFCFLTRQCEGPFSQKNNALWFEDNNVEVFILKFT